MKEDPRVRSAKQRPSWALNANANSCHAFGIFMAAIGSLHRSCCSAR
jgi:hypothetical protein